MVLLPLLLLAPLGSAPTAEALPMPPPPPGMSLVQPQQTSGEALPMPPPPQGMKLLAPEDKRALLGKGLRRGDAADPEESEEIESESADLEALRALEQVALDPEAEQGLVLLESLRRLGPGNPLRLRLSDVLEDHDHREEAPPELGRITNLLAFDVSAVQDRYDIPVEMQPLVADYIRFFQGPGRRWFRKWMSRSTRYLPVMQPILEREGLPRDTVYLAMIESGFSAQAYSWAHAAGPWQFIPGTGREFGLRQDFWVDERRDPLKSTLAAARYLKQLHGQLGHWYLAWAGYNTGGGRVRRLCNRKGTTDFWVISDGRGLATETKHYVPKLIAAALVAKNPAAFGFRDDEFDYQPPLEFDLVDVPAPTDLAVLARAAGVDEEALRDLNPELKRWCTPPASEDQPYRLRVPKGHGPQFAENFAKVPRGERMRYAEHRIRRGDTLSVIARKYGTETEAIMRLNRLTSARSLKVNTVLMIPMPLPPATKERGRREAGKLRPQPAARRDAAAPQPEPAPAAPAPVQAASATATVGSPTLISYGVRDGDTLWGISQRFNCSVDNLVKWNNLSRHGRRLQVGTVLSIWQDRDAAAGGPARAAKVAPAQLHKVGRGETLWSVAQRYGVSVADLERWNGISDHRALRVGQKLRVVRP